MILLNSIGTTFLQVTSQRTLFLSVSYLVVILNIQHAKTFPHLMAILSRDYAVIQELHFPGRAISVGFLCYATVIDWHSKSKFSGTCSPSKMSSHLQYQEHILSLILVFALPSQVCIIWCSTALECFRRMIAKWGKTLWRPVLPPTLKITEEPTVNVYFS